MARMLPTFLLLLSLGVIMFNHASSQDFGASNLRYISDCSDVVWPSGVYMILKSNIPAFPAYCDANQIDGGWTVFQRRYDGSLDFYLAWDEYVKGFGKWDGEFWLGLEKLHQLTSSGSWRLKVLLEDWEGSTAYATYDSFSIGDEESNYALTVGGYSGTAGDALAYHNGMAFTTKDRDNDLYIDKNCAEDWKGAWWYYGCAWSNLNGLYLGPIGSDITAIGWYYWKNSWDSLKSSTMMIRPA